jgi:hypothetical protein
MSGLDALFTDLASSLITEYGTPAVLTQVTPGAYDPATGTTAAGTTTNTNVSAVLDATSLKTLGYKFGEGLVQGGDIEATIPGKSINGHPPLPQDTLTFNGWPWVIVGVRPTYSGGVAVSYQLLVRR